MGIRNSPQAEVLQGKFDGRVGLQRHAGVQAVDVELPPLVFRDCCLSLPRRWRRGCRLPSGSFRWRWLCLSVPGSRTSGALFAFFRRTLLHSCPNRLVGFGDEEAGQGLFVVSPVFVGMRSRFINPAISVESIMSCLPTLRASRSSVRTCRR